MFTKKQMQRTVPGAPDFTWAELTASTVIRRLGVAKAPGPDQVMRLGHVCATLAQPARDALGPIAVSSGLRCPRLNKAVGGAADSAHLYGAALDLVPRKVPAGRLFAWLAANAADWDQIIWEQDSLGRQWVHASLWPFGERHNRRQLLKKNPRNRGRCIELDTAEQQRLLTEKRAYGMDNGQLA